MRLFVTPPHELLEAALDINIPQLYYLVPFSRQIDGVGGDDPPSLKSTP
jgi:hypothetical protein